MSGLAEPLREHPSTYWVQDRSNLEEIARLEVQDKMLTLGMGGVLPELADHSHLRGVLDVGCGTGGWLLELARTYPTIERLVGVDISGKMMAYARAQAKAGLLDGRVRFQTMDALRLLEFPPASFDLVNQRFGMSWLRTWEWAKLLSEYRRVTRSGGIMRITESNTIAESNSPALKKLGSMILGAFYRSGRLFAPSADGVTCELVPLMTRYGIEDVKYRVHTLTYKAGTEACQYFYEDVRHFSRVMLPFFQKWTHMPSDYQETCQQAFREIEQPDFIATMTLLTAWGVRP